jgi:hypothetical protein
MLFSDVPQLPQSGIKFVDKTGSGSDQSLTDCRQLNLTCDGKETPRVAEKLPFASIDTF